MMNLIGFCIMMFIFFHMRKKGTYKWGILTAFYFIWYGVTRAIIEPFRLDSLLMFGSSQIVFNRVSFVLSLGLIVLGIVLLWATKAGRISQENAGCMKNDT